MQKPKALYTPIYIISIEVVKKMVKREASEKGAGIEEEMSGSVNVEKGEASFPAVIDTLGKVVIPGYVREMLKIGGKKVRVQIQMQVKEEFE